MRELDLKEIRKKTLEMMDYIHDLCVKNDIQYFLIYGTLIGAIRHNGFIPWDDDFDIAMKRQDYIKFCQIVEREKHPYYKLCNRKNTLNYYYGIARFADKRYKYVSELRELKNADIGIFIDVYPLDHFGNTPEEAVKIKHECLKINTQYIIYCNRRSLQGKFRTLLRMPVHYFYRLKYGKNFSSTVDDLMYKKICSLTHEDDKQIGLICWDATCWPYKKEWFDEALIHEFEGHFYMIPKEYDSVLRMVYGDYMKLPPEDKRVPTHSYKIFERD